MLAGVLASASDLAIVLAKAADHVGGGANVEDTGKLHTLRVEARLLALDDVDPPFSRQGQWRLPFSVGG